MANDDLCQVSHPTIGRTRPGLIDPETGIALEQSIPVLGSMLMYDRDGNLLDVPTRCHRAVAASLSHFYWPRALRDLLKDGEYIQSGICPHTPREQLATRDGAPKPSVPAPKGHTFCDGSGTWSPSWRPDAVWPGCSHVEKVVTARHKRAAATARKSKGGANIAAAQAIAEQMAKTALIGANAEAQRSKGFEVPKVGA